MKQITVRNATPKRKSKAAVTVTETVSTAPRRRRRRNRRGAGTGSSIPPYVATLLDPSGFRGVSIPDTISMATGTYSYSLDFSIPVDTSGNGCCFFCPKMFLGNATINSATGGSGLIGGNSSTTAGYGLAATPLTPIQLNPDVSANVERFRVVSASLEAWSSSAPTAISGRVCSALLPSDFDLGGTMSVSTFAGFSQLPNAVTSHAIEGARSLYLPGGPDDLLYNSCNNDTVPIHAFALATNGSFHSTNNAAGGSQVASGPTLVVAINNSVASVSWNARIVVNIQFQSANNNSFVTLDSVEQDPRSMSMAAHLAQMPQRLLGFYEKHAERLSGIADYLMRGPIPRLAGQLGVQALQNYVSRALPSAGVSVPRLQMARLRLT